MDILDFPQLFGETLARVRARMDADANAGLSSSDEGWIDTREGSFYWDVVQPCALECARLWDAMTEAVAAAFPSTAWDTYLDEHGVTFQITRTPAQAATGTLLFTTTKATQISTATQVSAIPSDPSGDAVTFQTTDTGLTFDPLAIPESVVVTPSGTGGTLVAGDWIYHVTAVNAFGETTGSADQIGTIATTTGKNTIAWAAVVGTDDYGQPIGYRIYRTLIANGLGELLGYAAILSVNGDFEAETVGQAPLDWLATAAGPIGAGPSTLTVQTTQKHGGAQSMRVVNSASNQGAHVLLGEAHKNQEITAWAWVYVPTTQNVVIAMEDNVDGHGLASVTTSVDGTTWTEISVTWTPTADSPNAALYIYTPAGGAQTWYIDDVTLSCQAFLDDGSVTPSGLEPEFNSTSGVRIDAVAIEEGVAGNLGAGALDSLDTTIPEVIAVTNEEATEGGAEEEGDESFRGRLLAQFRGRGGGGNITDYERWSLAWGVERVSVVPVWDGPGTVLVIAMVADGGPVTSTVVDGLQQYLDPVAGQGHGQAPIGATVTVDTSTTLTVPIVATITFEDGYSLDGDANTVATRDVIEQALKAYIDSIEPGGTIVYQHVSALFFVEGVQSIAGLTVNGGVVDITLTTLQVPTLGTVTLS